jgi:mitochondrial chaperone BCS1
MAAEWFERLFSADNAVFQGGFGLAMLAVGAQTMRFGSNFAMNLARKHLLISLEITSKDRAYPWVLQWITTQGTRTQHLSVETVLRSTTNHSSSTIFNLVPGPGYHFIFYRNNFLGSIRLIFRLCSHSAPQVCSGSASNRCSI